MSIVVNKKELSGYMWAGDEVTSLFCGDKQVWPEVAGRNAVHIKWPEKGTDEWALMWYALWVNRRFPDTSGVRIGFDIDGVYYYVDARDSQYESIQMEGGVLFFSDGQKARLEGKVPEDITFFLTTPKIGLSRFSVEGEVEKRGFFGIPLVNSNFPYPLLEMNGVVSSDGGEGNLHIELIGEPSKVIHSETVIPITSTDSDVTWEAKKKLLYKKGVSIGDALDGSYYPGDYGFSVRVWCDAPDIRGDGYLYFASQTFRRFSVKVIKAF